MDKALKTMIANMPEKTGKSLQEWKKILHSKNFVKHSEGLNYLKKEFNVSHGYANTIVHLSKEETKEELDLLSQQYKGKESLFPIYSKMIEYVQSLGNDIKIVPKKTSVSLIRKKQFALIKPATKTRIDLGLKLKDVSTTEKLGNSGPFGTMCTHRIKISTVEDLDEEVKNWILNAYNQSI